MPLDERKRLVRERDWDNDMLYVQRKYLEDADYRDVIYGELIRLTLKLYE